MHNRFLQFIKKHALIDNRGTVLLAISGGVDSMLLWHLVHTSKIDYAIAHCNFKLRGSESDADEAFVKEKAGTLGVKCQVQTFDTKSYATINKVSTQMAARDLRYAWFDELCNQNGYSKIFLAHHANDDVETVLLNMARGTSIKGLTGMEPVVGRLVRPLLDIPKDEILKFAKANGINWREDSSNTEVHYKRNFVRKEIVPAFESLNPDFLQTMKRNMAKNEEVAKLTRNAIDQLKSQLLRLDKTGFSLKKSTLIDSKIGPYVLSEVLKEFGFNYTQAEDMIVGLDGVSGKVYHSLSYELVIDRDLLKGRLIVENQQEEYLMGKDDGLQAGTFEYASSILDGLNVQLDKTPANAMFDLAKLSFPLTLRKWRVGDKFQPIGMKGKKLVSDLLIDLKLSVFDKESVYVLCSQNEVVWVVGYRISENFKVESGTRSVLYYRLTNSKLG